MEENKKKRLIGRTTFGISLILLGITIALQTILPIDLLRYVLMAWPLIIISIGIEILYYSNKDNFETKYDFLGIILTGIIVFFGIGFSVLNYGVNKILYSNVMTEYLTQEREYYTNRYFDSKLNIISLDDKAVKLHIIEDKNLYDTVKATIKFTSTPSKNIIANIFDDNDYYEKYIDTYGLDEDVATLELFDLPSNYNAIEITILTDSKDKITTNGLFDNF